MLLRVLGPIQLVGPDGPVPLSAAKLRSVLAALAIARGRPVHHDALIDALWADHPPRSAAKLLQVYVSQLRRLVPQEARIVTGGGGYALSIDEGQFDALVFEGLSADGRAALRDGNAALAASLLRRAMTLWRGDAYADVRYEDYAQEEIVRLDAQRRVALRARFEAELQLGRHADLVGELGGLVTSDPGDEPLIELAMVAAYRTSGAPAALAVFDEARVRLLEEMGEGPGPALVALRDRISRRDPTLDGPTVLVDASTGAAVDGRPYLAMPPNPLIGRTRELGALRDLLARPAVRLVSLTGAGGTGKSRLALELAHEVGATFANGAVLVELAALGDPDLVIPTIARALGVEPGPDAAAALAAALAGREVLVIVDNFEHVRAAAPGIVRLLAAAPRLKVVATTRVVLHVSGEHVVPVTPLEGQDAVALFVERARSHDPGFVLDAAAESLVATICERVDALPLAIELAAARVQALGLRAVEARLGKRLRLLTGGPRDLPARQQTLRETLAWSGNLLEPCERDVLASLAVFPAGCSMEAAVQVAEANDEIVSALVDHHLVQVLGAAGERRYRLLETVREYAYELLGDRRHEVEDALVDWVVELVHRAALNDGSPAAEVLHSLDLEIDTIRDAFRYASRDPAGDREMELAAGIWRYWWIRGLLAEGRAVVDGILARRGVMPTRVGARTVRAAASLAWSMGHLGRARELAQQALDLAVAIGDPFEVHTAHNLLGVLATTAGDIDGAEYHHGAAIAVAEAHDLQELAMTSKLNLGVTYLEAGRLDAARYELELVLAHRLGEGLSEGVGFVQLNLGETEFEANDLTKAEIHFDAAAAVFRSIGFTARLANTLQGLAAVEARTARPAAAARRLGLAAALLGDVGWGADGTSLEPIAMEEARRALGDEDFDRLFREGASAAR